MSAFDRFATQWARVGMPGTVERIDDDTARVTVPEWALRVTYDADLAARILSGWGDGDAKDEETELHICEHFGATGAAIVSESV